MIPRVLSIAGTDPTGGAGSQADIKSITAAGGFGYAVTTAVLAQNTQGVRDIWMMAPDAVTAQLASVTDDCEIDAVKIGMLGSIELMGIVREFLTQNSAPVVLDPVMVATSGDRLIDDDALETLRDLLHHATVITPNIPELEILADVPTDSITSFEAACAEAQKIAARYDILVTVKGGHLDEPDVPNALVSGDGVVCSMRSPRVPTSNTHGTGCSFSSALATRLGMGEPPAAALEWAVRWIDEAIAASDALHVGRGNGPIHHGAQFLRIQRAGSNTSWQCADPTIRLDQVVESGRAPLDGSDDNPLLCAQLAPAGPWTAAIWELTKPLMSEIWQLPFIIGLRDGHLSRAEFVTYQHQDAMYLQRYSQALATLAGKARRHDERLHWASDAAACVTAETELHDEWLSKARSSEVSWILDTPMSPITMGYTDFLLARAASDNYVVGVAAVLPCAWLYGEIGLQLVAYNRPDHPYASWLTMYSDEAFLSSARKGIEIAERVLSQAHPDDVALATEAFLGASEWEREFFDQTSRMDLRHP